MAFLFFVHFMFEYFPRDGAGKREEKSPNFYFFKHASVAPVFGMKFFELEKRQDRHWWNLSPEQFPFCVLV
jgi:hypothetical protein